MCVLCRRALGRKTAASEKGNGSRSRSYGDDEVMLGSILVVVSRPNHRAFFSFFPIPLLFLSSAPLVHILHYGYTARRPNRRGGLDPLLRYMPMMILSRVGSALTSTLVNSCVYVVANCIPAEGSIFTSLSGGGSSLVAN